jgi:hypothetical protein
LLHAGVQENINVAPGHLAAGLQVAAVEIQRAALREAPSEAPPIEPVEENRSWRGGRRSPSWLQKAAELLPGRNPTQRVFRPNVGIEGAGRLTAGAGERYVAAVSDHSRAYARAARSFGLPKTAQPGQVREALSAHVESVSARKARALAQLLKVDRKTRAKLRSRRESEPGAPRSRQPEAPQDATRLDDNLIHAALEVATSEGVHGHLTKT